MNVLRDRKAPYILYSFEHDVVFAGMSLLRDYSFVRHDLLLCPRRTVNDLQWRVVFISIFYSGTRAHT